jgi:hypothetical protein
MKKIRILAFLNFIFFLIACFTANITQLKILGLPSMADVSRKYDTVFTPMGVTFAIWGVIYLSLFAFTIYHLIKASKEDAQSVANHVLVKIGYLFIINNLACTLWVFAFLNDWLLLSVVLMLIQLLALIFIFIKLNLYDGIQSFENKLFTQFPLSIYFAWICVATIANISSYLVSSGWAAFGISNTNWAIALIFVVLGLSLFIILIKKNVFFGLVILWAIYGIILKREAVDASLYHQMIVICYFVLGLISGACILQLFRNSKRAA